MSIYLGSMDNLTRRPVMLPTAEPVTFIAIANPASLHALSYLQDVASVSQAVFFDVHEPQVRWHKRCVELIQKHTSRQMYLEELLNVKLHREGDQLSWEGADLQGLAEVTGLSLLTEHPTNRKCGLLAAHVADPATASTGGTGSHVTLGDYPENMHPVTRNAYLSLGWNYGYLLPGVFNRPLPSSVRHVTGKASTIVNEVLKTVNGRAVVWLTNAATYPPAQTIDPTLLAEVRRWCADPNVLVWTHCKAPDAVNPTGGLPNVPPYKKVFRSPHAWWSDAVTRDRRSGTLLEVLTTPQQDRASEFTDGRAIGWKTLLNEQTAKVETIVLHILSSANNPELLPAVFSKAKELAKRVIVAEHNRYTNDRDDLHGNGLSIPEIREIAGCVEDKLTFVPGRIGLRRNMLLSFDKP